MIVIYVVKIDGKSFHNFCNARVPSRVIDGTLEIVHACWIWVGFRLLSENWCVQQNICYVIHSMVLSLDLVHAAQHLDRNTFCWTVDWVFNISSADSG